MCLWGDTWRRLKILYESEQVRRNQTRVHNLYFCQHLMGFMNPFMPPGSAEKSQSPQTNELSDTLTDYCLLLYYTPVNQHCSAAQENLCDAAYPSIGVTGSEAHVIPFFMQFLHETISFLIKSPRRGQCKLPYPWRNVKMSEHSISNPSGERWKKAVKFLGLILPPPHRTPTHAFLFCPCQQTSGDVDSSSGLSPFRERLDKESVKEENVFQQQRMGAKR